MRLLDGLASIVENRLKITNHGAGRAILWKSRSQDSDLSGYASQSLLGRGERIPGRDRKYSVHEETGERWNEAVERVRGTGDE